MKKVYSILLALVICSICYQVTAQNETILPKGFTKTEKNLVTHFEFKSNKITPPPEGPVRTMAEWEEIEYLVIRWTTDFQNILLQIVQAATQECKVLITTQDQALVQSFLNSNGVDMSQVEFLNAPSNSIWIRDYAGNTIYSNDVGERALVDWIYNRPRPLDDEMPVSHSNHTGVPIFRTISGTNDLVNTGGNFMSDGLGTAFASKLILQENENGNIYGVSAKTEAQIDQILMDYQGINNFIKMDQVPFDPIDHIDMHMKLLDEQTILVSKYPNGVADGPQIEANIDYVTSTFQTPFGTDYKIEWIDAPPSTGGNYPDTGGSYRTYTNSIFVNKTILVPTYRPEVDQDALNRYEELLPGYTVVGIDVDNPGEDIISLNGAIHCITHSIGVSNPLWIVHQPIEEVNTLVDIPFTAMIKHDSGVQSAKLFWRETGATNFQEAAMSFDADDIWSANINLPGNATSIEYYIWAEANSGKTITRPLVAPNGYWKFDVTNLSVSDWVEKNIVGPYPNPTRNQVSFNLNNIPGTINISIHNVLGQELYNKKTTQGDGKITLNLNSNWNGTLFITFSGDFGKVHRKVLKL